MYFCDEGLVLRKRPFRDDDSVVTIFTKTNGRIEVVFKGVRKPKAKLRALSENFCYGDYRFYLAKTSNFPVCTGGKIISAFNKIRLSEDKLIASFYLTELMLQLTSLSQPSPEKFELLLNAFNYLENNSEISKIFFVSYALILIDYCGIGFRKTNPGINSEIWEKLHNPFFSEIENLEEELKASDFSMIANLTFEKIKEHTTKDINTLKFVKIL